ncbi:hypothetical protein L6475_13785 [Prevotella sp. E9-3]|uniref:hypothetical protein n=1 Tax=Prevotella sp. E9-3 TaxID=2913621 RepID=UPI001EDAC7AF|nr:hypothetical protein [Prevotella sp. E9-3]UKK48255.1 hypothetical protein L6475_13785 [Prevotella sp. E9-3]
MEKKTSQYQQIETCEQLRSEIETALKKKLQTPKDFEFLRERIYARLHILVSRTTLMRFWGYINEDVSPRKATLDILAQFLGYQDLDGYCQNSLLPKEQQSSPVMCRRLSVAKELVEGERLRLTWNPERICDIEYLGNLQFRVVASENTRLKTGDTFECSLIIEGEPLYLDNLKQGDQPPIAYVCGKKSGVFYEYMIM